MTARSGGVWPGRHTARPKKGTLSVGVARQYCGPLGQRANGPALVSLPLAQEEGPIPVGLRLFLPEGWTRAPERCAAAGVPEAAIVARRPSGIVLARLDRRQAAGVRFGILLADAGYGASAEFRHGLDEGGRHGAVGIPRNQKVSGEDVQLVPPGGGKRRPVPDPEPRPAAAGLAAVPWRRVVWRHGTQGPLAARCAATRVRGAEGSTWAHNRHLPGPEGGMGGRGARAASASPTPATSRPGPRCPPWPLRSRRAGSASRRLRTSSRVGGTASDGLGHCAGGASTGPHRPARMTCIALAALQRLRLAAPRSTGPGTTAVPRSRTAPIAAPARHPPQHHRPAVRAARRAGPPPALQAPPQPRL
jgi:hypothetical protein